MQGDRAQDVSMQTFYDQHPYPPPVSDLDAYKESWTEDRLRVDHHLHWPETGYRDDLAILVAGCGTSQAAKHAIRQPSARVTGIDISSNSLEHTQTLIKKYALENLTIHQLPLERVNELKLRFDKIVCTGVLHHLSDPEKGLRSLRSVLKPGGVIHLMVYAPYGRWPMRSSIPGSVPMPCPRFLRY